MQKSHMTVLAQVFWLSYVESTEADGYHDFSIPSAHSQLWPVLQLEGPQCREDLHTDSARCGYFQILIHIKSSFF